jgi:hypothetical protein
MYSAFYYSCLRFRIEVSVGHSLLAKRPAPHFAAPEPSFPTPAAPTPLPPTLKLPERAQNTWLPTASLIIALGAWYAEAGPGQHCSMLLRAGLLMLGTRSSI